MITLHSAHWPHGGTTSLKFALAVASRLLLATAPLNAAEQLDDVQPHTPLEVARQIEALTAGGLFDPARTIPFDAHDASFLSDHDSQR